MASMYAVNEPCRSEVLMSPPQSNRWSFDVSCARNERCGGRTTTRCSGKNSQSTHEQKDDQDQHNQSQSSARVVAPARAIGPCGKGADQKIGRASCRER